MVQTSIVKRSKELNFLNLDHMNSDKVAREKKKEKERKGNKTNGRAGRIINMLCKLRRFNFVEQFA